MADPLRSALFTDLYELTMAQAYATEAMEAPAVFELFFREMPARRNYFIAAGLDDVLTCLEQLRFTEDDLEYLCRDQHLSAAFLDRLRGLRFTGDVYAMPEGTPAFPDEPLVQVVAPMIEAQIVETLVLNQVHFQTVAATKAARVVHAAAGRAVVDFGSRRAHGTDAALKVARTSYLAGAAGTSLVLAGKLYGIPVFGTLAHSYVQAHDDEWAAFEVFARQYPNSTLLVDTYETLQGVRKVIELSRRLGIASACMPCVSIRATLARSRSRRGKCSTRQGCRRFRSSCPARWTNIESRSCSPAALRLTASASARGWRWRTTCRISIWRTSS